MFLIHSYILYITFSARSGVQPALAALAAAGPRGAAGGAAAGGARAQRPRQRHRHQLRHRQGGSCTPLVSIINFHLEKMKYFVLSYG